MGSICADLHMHRKIQIPPKTQKKKKKGKGKHVEIEGHMHAILFFIFFSRKKKLNEEPHPQMEDGVKSFFFLRNNYNILLILQFEPCA